MRLGLWTTDRPLLDLLVEFALMMLYCWTVLKLVAHWRAG